MERAAGRGLVLLLLALGRIGAQLSAPGLAGFHPVDAVVLHEAGCDVGKNLVAKERIEVVLDAVLVPLDVDWAALALGDDLELVDEARCGFLEGLALLQLASAILAEQAEIPVARHPPWPREAGSGEQPPE